MISATVQVHGLPLTLRFRLMSDGGPQPEAIARDFVQRNSITDVNVLKQIKTFVTTKNDQAVKNAAAVAAAGAAGGGGMKLTTFSTNQTSKNVRHENDLDHLNSSLDSLFTSGAVRAGSLDASFFDSSSSEEEESEESEASASTRGGRRDAGIELPAASAASLGAAKAVAAVVAEAAVAPPTPAPPQPLSPPAAEAEAAEAPTAAAAAAAAELGPDDLSTSDSDDAMAAGCARVAASAKDPARSLVSRAAAIDAAIAAATKRDAESFAVAIAPTTLRLDTSSSEEETETDDERAAMVTGRRRKDDAASSACCACIGRPLCTCLGVIAGIAALLVLVAVFGTQFRHANHKGPSLRGGGGGGGGVRHTVTSPTGGKPPPLSPEFSPNGVHASLVREVAAVAAQRDSEALLARKSAVPFESTVQYAPAAEAEAEAEAAASAKPAPEEAARIHLLVAASTASMRALGLSEVELAAVERSMRNALLTHASNATSWAPVVHAPPRPLLPKLPPQHKQRLARAAPARMEWTSEADAIAGGQTYTKASTGETLHAPPAADAEAEELHRTPPPSSPPLPLPPPPHMEAKRQHAAALSFSATLTDATGFALSLDVRNSGAATEKLPYYFAMNQRWKVTDATDTVGVYCGKTMKMLSADAKEAQKAGSGFIVVPPGGSYSTPVNLNGSFAAGLQLPLTYTLSGQVVAVN